MNVDFELILEDCLVRMHSGATLEECLAAYPAQADALSPLLLATSQVRKIARPKPRPEAVQAGLERVLATVATQTKTQGISIPPVSKSRSPRYLERIFTTIKTLLFGKETTGMKLALRLAIDLVVILMIGGVMTINASARSLPGDPLYSVKRTWEEVRLTLTLNDQARLQLQNQMQQLRIDEVQEMIQNGRTGTVEFDGRLESIAANEWIVSGLRVGMLPDTIVEGTPEVGQLVRVRARVQNDGTITALQVSLHTQAQNPNPYPSPMSTQSPVTTPLPSRTPWPTHMWEQTHEPTYDPTHMPWSTYGPNNQAWPTDDHHNDMPRSTPWPNDNHHNDNDPCYDCGQHNNSGGSSWSGGGSGSPHSWP